MSPMIPVSDEIYSRLEGLAVGFDTPSSVIERLIHEHDKNIEESVGYDKNQTIPKSEEPSEKRLFTNREIQQRIAATAQNLSAQELEYLCDDQISKELFALSFPLFIRVSAKANQATKREAVKTNDGVSRWTWKFGFEKEGYAYAVCTQWFLRNDLYVKKWLEAHE